jgi:LuxR family maltose regulon positive regulatory protein
LVDLARTGLPGGHPGQLVFQVLASMGEQTALVLTHFVGHPDPLIRGAAFKLLDYFQRDNSPTLIPTLKSYALGPLRVYRYAQSVETPDWKRNKVKLLWLILLHRRGKPIARDVVADLLWPEAQPVTARNNLRATVHGLKRTLQPDLGAGKDSHYVTGDRETLWLVHLDDMWFDLWEFEDQVARARTALRNGKKEEAAQLFQAACDLCRGAFLPEASFADYFNDLRTRIEQTYILGCLEVARYQMTVRDHRTALEYARRVLALDASIEEAYQVLITGYLSLGEREGAMQAYKTCRKYLRQMLGAEPSTKTRKLLEA